MPRFFAYDRHDLKKLRFAPANPSIGEEGGLLQRRDIAVIGGKDAFFEVA